MSSLKTFRTIVNEVQHCLVFAFAGLHQLAEILAAAIRKELIFSIMVVNAVREEYTLGIYLKILIIFTVPIPLIIRDYLFKHFS